MTKLGGGEAWFLSLGLAIPGCLDGMFAERGERHSGMFSVTELCRLVECRGKSWWQQTLDASGCNDSVFVLIELRFR